MQAASTAAKMSIMAIHSSFLGSVKVSGDDAKSFSRKITNGRGTKAAAEAPFLSCVFTRPVRRAALAQGWL